MKHQNEHKRMIQTRTKQVIGLNTLMKEGETCIFWFTPLTEGLQHQWDTFYE